MNNLGGKGRECATASGTVAPDDDDDDDTGDNRTDVLRYANLVPGGYDGQPVDLVVSIAGGAYTPKDYCQTKLAPGGFAQLNLATTTNVTLRFDFVHPSGRFEGGASGGSSSSRHVDAPATLPAVTITFFDLDGTGSSAESLCVDKDQWDHARAGDEVLVTEQRGPCERRGAHGTPVGGGSYVFDAVGRGFQCDNPFDGPMHLHTSKYPRILPFMIIFSNCGQFRCTAWMR